MLFWCEISSKLIFTCFSGGWGSKKLTRLVYCFYLHYCGFGRQRHLSLRHDSHYKSKSVLLSQVFLYSNILALSSAWWWIHLIQKIQVLTPVAASMVTDNDITSCSGRDNDKGCYDGSTQKVAKSDFSECQPLWWLSSTWSKILYLFSRRWRKSKVFFFPSLTVLKFAYM